MSYYALTTEWDVAAPLAQVWTALMAAERWPAWWTGLQGVIELVPGMSGLVGCVRRFTWKGRLPYTLTMDLRVMRIEPPRLLEGLATGDVEGVGRWELEEQPGGTHVRCTWRVRTTKRWMRWLDPVARRAFVWNHDAVMQAGGRGLKQLLERSPQPATA